MQNLEQLRAMIKSIPATPEGDRQIAMLANSPDPMKRMLAGIEANERARTRQAQKAMQGQQQQGRPPVVQEKLAQLADAGLGSLDVGQDMFNEKSYEGGGIVAFDGTNGSYVSLEDALKQYQDAQGGLFTPSDRRKITDPETGEETTVLALKEKQYLNALRRGQKPVTFAPVSSAQANAPAAAPVAAKPDAAKPDAVKPDAAKPPVAKPPVAKPDAAKPDAQSADDKLFSMMESYLKGDPAEKAALRKEARDLTMLETGLAMYGGESPYASVNIGQAGKQGAKSYQDRLAGIRRDERETGKNLAELGLERYKLGQARSLAELQRQTQKDVANIYASSRGDADDKTRAGIIKGVTASVDKNLGRDTAYMKLKTPEERAKYRNKMIQDELNLYGVDGTATAGNKWAGWSQGQ